MDLESRLTLSQDLAGLRDCGRSHLDTLSLWPSDAMLVLQVQVNEGTLELVYPSNRLFDLGAWLRFIAFSRKNRLSLPRFEWWGHLVALRAAIGSDVDVAVELVDSCIEAVFRCRGAFRLQFQRMGMQFTGDA